MRSKEDALRSLQKYVSQVLSPNPVLAALSYGSTIWTTAGMVAGAIDLDVDSWMWLRHQDRHPPVEVGSADDPATYYLSSGLIYDPLDPLSPEPVPAGVTLTGDVVTDWDLPNQPSWEVRLFYDRGEIPADRPHARVHFVGAGPTTGSAHYYEIAQPMAIECYPMPAADVKTSTVRACAVEDALLEGFRGAGVQLGRPLRIPLWDFDGVPLTETSTVRGAADYMRLLDFSTRQLPDLEDPRNVRVVADLRVSWRRDLDMTRLQRRTPGTVKGTRLVRYVGLEIDGS